MDTLHLAQYLHTQHRLARGDTEKRGKILLLADQFVEDYKHHRAPGHATGSLHLLSLYKEEGAYDRGVELWQWLEQQDTNHVNSNTYGAAIELLAKKGETLDTLEAYYVKALKRFPGTFAEYHLSHNAILPDRSAEIQLRGVHALLLQAILTARLLHGDVKSAYYTVDTVLRLLPTQTPGRIFQLLWTSRPAEEGYTAFMLACRAGIELKQDRLTNLFSIVTGKCYDLLKQKASLQQTTELLKCIDAGAELVYAYVCAGGKVNGYHVNRFLGILQSLVVNMRSDDSKISAKSLPHRKLIVTFARQVIRRSTRDELDHSVVAHHRALYIASQAMLPDEVDAVKKDILALGIEDMRSTWRAFVLAAG
jgi:hypothetical protein